jgi:hypothetical protein
VQYFEESRQQIKQHIFIDTYKLLTTVLIENQQTKEACDRDRGRARALGDLLPSSMVTGLKCF